MGQTLVIGLIRLESQFKIHFQEQQKCKTPLKEILLKIELQHLAGSLHNFIGMELITLQIQIMIALLIISM